MDPKFAEKFLPKNDTLRYCSKCKTLLDMSNFSKRQLKTPRAFRKCTNCIIKLGVSTPPKILSLKL